MDFDAYYINKSTEVKAPNLCAAPWGHIHTTPNGDLYPCCYNRDKMGNINDSNFQEIFNNEKYKNLRRQFLANERPAGCIKCFTQEDNGYKSLRTRINNTPWGKNTYTFADKLTLLDGTINDIEIRDADFRFSNKCNMACVMCSPDWSTKWASELKVESKYLQVFENNAEFIKNYLDQVQVVSFAGGEPLIMDEHWQILDLLKGKNVKLIYSSNGSSISYKNKNALDYWANWKGPVDVILSIDSIFEKAEYIRYGISWKQVEDNIKKITSLESKHKHIRIISSSSIGMYNVFDIDKIYEHLSSLGIQVISLNPVAGNFSIQHMPQNAKKHAFNYLESIKNKVGDLRNFKIIQDLCNTPTNGENLRTTRHQIQNLDKRRNLNFFKTFPELKKYY